MRKSSYDRLNEYQKAAVLDESPACVVNANVGSGKTTVLIEKILYLHYERKVPLDEMIVLTFTNKAAGEIRDRLETRERENGNLSAEESLELPGFGTFHSVALYLLKEKLPLEMAGWKKDFLVMDPEEELDLAMEIIAENQLKVKYKNRLKKRLEQEYAAYLAGGEETRYKDDLYRLYLLLEEEKKRQNKMTFSDLLRVSTELLKGEKEHAESGKYTVNPQWIIVDEVQDSDTMQLEFIDALKWENTHLFAVGDPNQVIYSWRGTGDNMFFLLKHKFQAKELSLPVNYRSNASILEAANRFQQFGTQITGAREAGAKIRVNHYYDPFQEAEDLVDRIRKIHSQGIPYDEIAILYRLQKQSEILTKVFDRNEVPYELSVKKTWKEIPALDWLIKVLRYSVNPADVQTGTEVLLHPVYGISSGKKLTKKKAKEIVRDQLVEASEFYRNMVNFSEWYVDNFEKKKEACEKDLESKQISVDRSQKIFDYFQMKEALRPSLESYEKDGRYVQEFLEKMCGQNQSLEQIKSFLNSAALYGMKLEDGEEEPGIERTNEGEAEEKTDAKERVHLMTLHASKGLEFDTVFLIGVNPGLIPIRSKSYEQEEEERRLFFVGMTRAKNTLELSWYTNPGEVGVIGEYSRYLKMIPPHLLSWDGEDTPPEEREAEERRKNLQKMRRAVGEEIRKKEQTKENLEESRKQNTEKKIQRRARHVKYGIGIVTSEDNMTIEVEFEGYGKKQFLKAFSEVEVLEDS